MIEYYVGIDLGTTNSTVSVIELESPFDNPNKSLKTCPIRQYGAQRTMGLQEAVCLPSALYFDIELKAGLYRRICKRHVCFRRFSAADCTIH